MTLDSSALVAILFAEPGYLELVDRILSAGAVRGALGARVDRAAGIGKVVGGNVLNDEPCAAL